MMDEKRKLITEYSSQKKLHPLMEQKKEKKKYSDPFKGISSVRFKSKSVPFTKENYSRFKKRTMLFGE